MKFGIYSIKDNLVGYSGLQILNNDAVAMRNFKIAMAENASKNDFTLFKLGYFDTDTAEIIIEEKRQLMEGSDCSEEEVFS